MCSLTLHSSISSTRTCKLKLNLAKLRPALDVPIKMVEHFPQGWSQTGLDHPIQNKEEPKLLHHSRHMERKRTLQILATLADQSCKLELLTAYTRG